MNILDSIYNWLNPQDSIKKELNNQKIKNISDQLESKGEDAIDECSICTDELVGHFITVLPCDTRHIFHTKCINLWLDKNTTCPLCKKNIKNEYNNEAKIKIDQSISSIIYSDSDNDDNNSDSDTDLNLQLMPTYNYSRTSNLVNIQEILDSKWETYTDHYKEIKLIETFNISLNNLVRVNNSHYKSPDKSIEYKFYADGTWQRSYL